jgi:hypothetical protein
MKVITVTLKQIINTINKVTLSQVLIVATAYLATTMQPSPLITHIVQYLVIIQIQIH